MTVKERLHALVDSMSEEQATRTLVLIEGDGTAAPRQSRESAFIGRFASGHTDTSRRVDDILAEGFGR